MPKKAVTTEERLAEIAEAIKKGAKAESFSAEMDRLLGTTMPERDQAAEEAFEASYRRDSGR